MALAGVFRRLLLSRLLGLVRRVFVRSAGVAGARCCLASLSRLWCRVGGLSCPVLSQTAIGYEAGDERDRDPDHRPFRYFHLLPPLCELRETAFAASLYCLVSRFQLIASGPLLGG